MEIRKFSKQKDGMYKLQFDEFSVSLHEDLILKYQLLLKKNISIDELDEIRLENNKYEAYNIALKYIKRRLRSEYEVRSYLTEKAISLDNINFTCVLLESQGYLNDKVYALSYLHDKINMSLDGPYKIRKYLSSNKVEDLIIDEVMSSFSKELERSRVEKIISKNIKINKSKSNNILQIKLKQLLINLGYSTDIINSSLSTIKVDDSSIKEKEYEKIKRKLSRKYSGSELEYKIRQKMYQKG
ncbi:MAG: hypothetical protein HFG48_01535, partial [Bacilli bacterium]|nr:hypothetical protein [Bacilli bacterium]